MQTTNTQDEIQFTNTFKLRMSVLEAIQTNYLFISLINTKTEQVTIIKSQSSINKTIYTPNEKNTYSAISKASIQRYVPQEQAETIQKAISLQHILEELKLKKEYTFQFYTQYNGQKRMYKIRFFNINEENHILQTFEFVDNFYVKQTEQLKVNAAQLRKERKFLDVLCRDYTSVYFYDMNQNTAEVLKIASVSNEVNIIGNTVRNVFNYKEELQKYCDAYVIEQDKKQFLYKLSPEHLHKELTKNSRYFYRYQCLPNKDGHEYFEAQVLRLNEDSMDNLLILAFRHIDDVIAAEKIRAQQEREKIAAQEKLELEKENAIQANEMKSRFLSSLSHDIRTPINGIMGLLNIADSYPNDLKKQQECRQKARVTVEYLNSLITNVLDMNQLENSSIQLQEIPFNLIDVLMNITTLTDAQVKEHGLHATVDWKPNYIKHRYLIGSKDGFSRILMNLNSNAIKYNKPTGSIYCRCLEKEVIGDIAWFELTISDTGIGMDEDFIESAFEPYTQKSKSLSSINGVGLGLSIVKQTVELMHGTIHVESKINVGTTFTILLPFKINHQPQKKQVNYEHLSLKGIRSLLVEDNNLNKEIAKFYLEQENIQVTCVSNGKEALDAFQASPLYSYDIILMDIVMLVMDGLEATKAIRSLNRSDAQTIPILAMSANAFQQDIEKSYAAGMNAHISKPLNGQELTNIMKKFLANKIQK